MSHPKDIDQPDATPGEDADRLLLVDLLYGDFDEPQGQAAREAAEQRVRDDQELADELAEFKHLRALMRELPDEEPPDVVSTRLLHAAAVQGPKPASEASDKPVPLWQRIQKWFMPVIAHPGLAAATSLVVVAGVAGAMYMSGSLDSAQRLADISARDRYSGVVARPEASGLANATSQQAGRTTPAAPVPGEVPAAAAPVFAPTPPAGGDSAQGDLAAAVPAEEAEADDDMATGTFGRAVGGQVEQRRAQYKGEAEERPSSTRRRARRNAPARQPSKQAPNRIGDLEASKPRESAAADVEGGVAAGGVAAGGVAAGGAASAAPADAPPPMKPRSAPSRSTTRKRPAKADKKLSSAPKNRAPLPPPATAKYEPSRADGDMPDQQPDDQQPDEKKADRKDSEASGQRRSKRAQGDAEQVRSLHNKASAAAKQNDCGAVRDAGRQIRKLDPGYYRRSFVQDQELRACLAPAGKK